MSNKSWLNLSIDGLSGNPAVLSFDLNEDDVLGLIWLIKVSKKGDKK